MGMGHLLLKWWGIYGLSGNIKESTCLLCGVGQRETHSSATHVSTAVELNTTGVLQTLSLTIACCVHSNVYGLGDIH